MQLGMVGLGRMGANMVRRLIKAGHSCVVYDLTPQTVQQLVAEGAVGSYGMEEFVKKLEKPRTAWLMVPAGAPTENTVKALAPLLDPGDVIIDGGNSYFKDDVRRAQLLRQNGIHYVDVGTSGGIWGIERGYSLMIGGEPEVVRRLDPIFQTLAPGEVAAPTTPNRAKKTSADRGYLHCGPVGSGHFVKMVHNGIEYGLMQAYAEGFDILRNASSEALAAEHRYSLPLGEIAEVWRRGSVVASWLLDLTAIAFNQDPQLENYQGYVADSGEGRWTIQAAIDEAVPANVLSAALYARFRSRQQHTFAEKILSAMRQQFGGHLEPSSDH